MRLILATLVLLFAAACAKTEAPKKVDEAAPQTPATGEAVDTNGGQGEVTIDEMRERSRAEIDEEACNAAGGVVRPEGLLGMYRCVKPYADAGKACRSSDDCEGKCLVTGDEATGEEATGACQANDSPFGCYAEIVDGKVANAICVD
ncbi:MAG: hypothetical protein R3C60_09685 [Parvularculaceae bacterium]